MQPVGRHVAESFVSVVEVDVVEVGLVIVAGLLVDDVVDWGGLRDIERPQDKRIQDAEDDDISADGEDRA